MEMFDKILKAVWSVLNSGHMKAFYWLSGAQFVAQFLEMLQMQLTNFDLPEWFVIGLGLAISRATKELNNKYGLKK